MIFHSKKLTKFLVSSVLLVQSVIAIASISITENPSYDGSYEMVIPPSVWAGFDTANVTGDLYENGEHVADIYYSSNNRYYLVSGNPLGEYQYRLRVQGPFANSNGGAGGYEDFYADATVLPPLPPEPTENLNLADFDLYYGDFNNDGLDGDIYFHQRDLFVLIAGDISIPLLLEQEIGFVIYRRSNSDEYSLPYLQRLNKEELTNYQKLRLNYDYFEGDINGDGKQDFFIRGFESFAPSVIALQTDIGFPEFILPNIDPYNSFDPSNRSNILRLMDYNLDGRADLVMLSSQDGYVLDVIYAMNDGTLDENYYTVSSLNQIFNFTTHPASAVGVLAGEFHVGQSGAANYSIPVFTPEGTAGVTPSVGMSYSSQNGNGIMGKGWSLNAFSIISRCRQTLGQDNNALPITFSDDDRFCLDGQRLVLIEGSGEYGAEGSTYRTAIDSQVLVTIHGDVGGEPGYFSALKKDGSITYYGLTDGLGTNTKSKQTFAAGKTIGWYQSVTLDNVGNPIKYFYTHDVNKGTNFLLNRIEYAFGASSSPNTVIRFDYEKRPDVINGYLAGQFSEQKWRLKRVDVDNTVNSKVNVRTYHIFYNLDMVGSTAIKQSLVGAIQECVVSSCKKPTKFTWDLVSGEIKSTEDSSIRLLNGNPGQMRDFRHADFNGDGLLDLVWAYIFEDSEPVGAPIDTRLRYAISSNGVLTPAAFTDGISGKEFPEDQSEPFRIEPIDFNADGRSDLAIYRSRGNAEEINSWHVYLSVPTIVNGKADWRLSHNRILTGVKGKNAKFADIDGDGLVDIIDGEQVYYLRPRFSNPSDNDYKSDTFYKFSSANSLPWTNIGLEHLPNVALWMWSEIPDGYEAYPWLSRGSTLVDSIPGDFNGDGLTDLIVVQERRATTPNYIDNSAYVSSYRTFVLMQKGGEYFEGVLELDRVDESGLIKVGDINRDGLSDIFLTNESSGDIKLYTSTGHGFEAPRVIASIGPESTYQLVDFNLDDFADIVEFRHAQDDVGYQPKIHQWNSDTQRYDKVVYGKQSLKGESAGFYMDVNGDGLHDFVRFEDKDIDIYLFKENAKKFEAISKIDKGNGYDIDINYEPINTSEHYAGLDVNPEATGTITGSCVPRLYNRCAIYTNYEVEDFYYALNKGIESSISRLSSKAPVLEMNGPFYVVVNVERSSPASTLDNDPLTPDGNSGAASIDATKSSEVEYYYNEAKIQAGGAGFLGFHRFTSVDKQTGISSSTILRQDFPFVGTALSTFVYAPEEAGLLSESHNVYELFGWPSDANATVKNGGTSALGTIKPYVRESVKVNYLTGSSVEGAGGLELLTGPQTNIGGCSFGVTNCHPYLNKTTNQLISHKVIVVNQVDEYGNTISTNVETSSDGLSQLIATSHEYGDGTETISLHGKTLSYAELGRLTETTVQKTRDGQTQPSQFTRFTYYGANEEDGAPGMLKTEEISPEVGGVTFQDENLVITRKYNNLGLLVTKETTGWNGYESETRRATTVYDPTGRFVNYTVDGLNHTLDQVITRNQYGSPTYIRGVNGTNVTKGYDVWGRETSAASNTGGSSTTSYVSCPHAAVHCPASAKMAIIQRTSSANNAITAVSYFDMLGREIRSGSISFDGKLVYVDTEYDLIGRVVRKSLPFFEDDRDSSHSWTRNYYDALGRPLLNYSADGAKGEFKYEGYEITSINDLGQEKTEIKNGLGELIEVEDHLEGKISYTYTTEGHLKTTTAYEPVPKVYAYGIIDGLCQQPTSNLQVVLCYDRLGRKTAIWDPDKGHWTYHYNAFGELVRQTNANGQYVQTKYDVLGRTKERWDYKSDGSIEGYTSWHYDNKDDQGQNVDDAILQTTAISYTSGRQHTYEDPVDVGEHITRYVFDSYGRPEFTDLYLPDGNIYRTAVEYDDENRVEYEYNVLNQEIIRGSEAIESGIRNDYNQSGFLEYIENLEDNKKIYEATGYDEKGNLLTANLGDGKVMLTNTYNQHTGLLTSRSTTAGLIEETLTYDWDPVGNLRWRVNRNSSLSGSKHLVEEFCYDGLNRFVKSFETINSTGARTNATCPIAGSGDVTYDAYGNIASKAGVGTYRYGQLQNPSGAPASNNRPLAGPHALTSVNNGVAFSYDKNGNLLNDGERNFVYSTFDKPVSISKGNHETKFKYGPSRNRFYREDINNANNTVEKTWYLGNVEKIEKANGSIEWRRMLAGGVMHTYTTNSNYVETAAVKKRYILNDHLGSSTFILEENSAGNIFDPQVMSFDVWGQRRNAQNMAAFSAAQLINFDHSITTRGYTGHEMLDEVGVIHMNGRIYDAKWGRFLQADPHIQAPTDTQSYNRYSYVRNNPLNATDPSGYFWEQVAMFVARAFIGYSLYSAGQMLDLPWLQVVGGYYLCGQSLQCAAGLAFGATYAATGSFSEAAFSSVVSVASGFAGQYLAKGFSWTTRLDAESLIVRMAVGGTLSEMTGGKFKNGAATVLFLALLDSINYAISPDLYQPTIDPNVPLKPGVETANKEDIEAYFREKSREIALRKLKTIEQDKLNALKVIDKMYSEIYDAYIEGGRGAVKDKIMELTGGKIWGRLTKKIDDIFPDSATPVSDVFELPGFSDVKDWVLEPVENVVDTVSEKVNPVSDAIFDSNGGMNYLKHRHQELRDHVSGKYDERIRQLEDLYYDNL